MRNIGKIKKKYWVFFHVDFLGVGLKLMSRPI